VVIVEPGVILTPIFLKVRRKPDLTSPYVEFQLRAAQFYMTRLLKHPPAPASLVAEVIDQALSADPPRLRWPAGWDAEAMIKGRQRMSDEEWVNFGGAMSDEEFVAALREQLGIALDQ